MCLQSYHSWRIISCHYCHIKTSFLTSRRGNLDPRIWYYYYALPSFHQTKGLFTAAWQDHEYSCCFRRTPFFSFLL